MKMSSIEEKKEEYKLAIEYWIKYKWSVLLTRWPISFTTSSWM